MRDEKMLMKSRRLSLVRKLPILGSLIPIFGVPSLLCAMVLFASVNPGYYDDSIPTISRTVSIHPASDIFVAFMAPCVVVIIASWLYAGAINAWRIGAVQNRTTLRFWLYLLNGLVSILGVVAGVSLFMLAQVTLESSLEGHMIVSYIFFFSQIITFIIDSVLTALLASQPSSIDLPQPVRNSLRRKTRFCMLIVASGLSYYALYFIKNFDFGWAQMGVQALYVFNEYTLCTLLFSYSLFYVPLSTYFSRRNETTDLVGARGHAR